MGPIEDELDRKRRELSELEELIPKTDPDGAARANLQERAEELARQISQVESAQEELRELQQATGDLDADSPLRSSLAPRIAVLRGELDAVGREEAPPSDQATRVGEDGPETGDRPAPSNDSAVEKIGAYLRQARAQQVASALVAVGFFLPWLDLVFFQLSGYSIVRFVFALDDEFFALFDAGNTTSLTTARIVGAIFLLLVIASAASALIPQRRLRGLMSYLSNSLLLAGLVAWFASGDGGEMLQAASVGLAIFAAGALLGTASGTATTLATHPTRPAGSLTHPGFAALACTAVAVIAALLLAFEEPLLAETGVAVAWFIAAAVVLVPRASPDSDDLDNHLEPSRSFGDWWRERRRMVLVAAISLLLVGAAGGGFWWWLAAPVDGPLEVMAFQSGDRSSEVEPSVTVRSAGESVTAGVGQTGDLTWNVDSPIRIEVTPQWTTQDEAFSETIDLADLGATQRSRSRGKRITVRVRFQERATRLDVRLDSGTVLLRCTTSQIARRVPRCFST